MRLRSKQFPRVPVKAYHKIRPAVCSGDLLLCSGSHVFSKLIQKATRSVWSHVGFVIRLDSIDRIMVLESVESQGVRTVPLSYYVKNYNASGKPYPGKVVIARHTRMENVARNRFKYMTQFAVDRFGYPYDKDEILRIAARIGMSLFGFTKKQVKQDNEYICSEYAWECYKRVGITVKYNKLGFIAPKDFARDPSVSLMARIV